MGKVGGSSWLNAVKKAFRSPFKDQQQDEVEKKRGKSRWIFRKPLYRETTIQHSNEETDAISETVNQASARNSASYRNINEAVQVEKRCTIAAALASAAAADAAQAAMEVVRFNTTRRPISAMRFRERLHFAAIAIQTAFRGYLARKALKALKGLVKLQAFVRGHNVRGRAKMTLQCMQSMVRVQAQLCDERSRRLSSSSSSPCLKKTKNSIFRDPINHDYICFRDTYPQMEEEIQPQEGYLNCKRRLGFSNIQEISIDNSTFENERTWFDPANTSMIKTIKVDTSQSHNFSPSPSKPLLHSINPRKSMSKPSLDNYNNYPRPVTPTKSVAQPNYMSDTASTKARIRAHSAPRMRPMTPEREHISRAAKRRISGQAQDQHNSDVDDSEFVPHFDQSMPR